MTTQSNVDLVRDAYAAFGTGDLPKLLSLMTPDVVWEFPASQSIPWAGTFTGVGEVARFFATLMEHCQPEEFVPLHFVAEANVDLADVGAGHTGRERFRVKSTGLTWACDWAHAFTVRDGKVASFREYTDTAAMAGALAKG